MQSFITIIPSKKKISDNRKRFPKDFTYAGWGLIILCAGTICCSIALFIISDNEQNLAQRHLDSELLKRDRAYKTSIAELSKRYTTKVDSSYKKSEATFIGVTARYGLHYDSLNHQLVKEKDTSKVETLPEISLHTITLDSTKKQHYYFSVQATNKQATANNIKTNFYVIIQDADGYALLPRKYQGYAHTGIVSINTASTWDFSFEADYPFITVIVLLKGTYTNLRGNKTINIRQILAYDFANKRVGVPIEDNELKLEAFLKTKKL